MSDDFTVRGAEQFLALSKRLKAAGEKELRKELNRGLREAAKPLAKLTKQEALRSLPSRGGLAALVASSPQKVQVRTGASTAGVRIVVGKKGGGARAADEGLIRHPVFGKPVFVTQPVTPGWFSETADRNAPAIRDEVAAVLEDFTRKVVG